MSQVRRILYVDLSPAVGGSVISLYYLVRGLDRSRFAPHVILRASNAYAARFAALGVPVTVLGETSAVAESVPQATWSDMRQSRLARWLKRNAFGEALVHFVGFYLRTYPGLRREAQALAEIMRAIQPDLVHLNDVIGMNRAAIMAARRLRLPAICHLRAMDTRNHYDRWLSHSLRGYICISRAIEQHLRRSGGRVEPRWIVYNGVDLSEFSQPTDTLATRAELGLGAEDGVVGCVGRLIAWKGQRTFLQALAVLAPSRPRLRGLIVGAAEPQDQGYQRELYDLTRALGLEGVVRYTGFRQDIPRLLQAMDIVVHASTSPEPFGRVLIEGMAAGTAVVGTAAGAVPEIIEDGVTGLLVPPGDETAMAQAVARLLDQPAERERLCRAARRAVVERFSVEQYVRGVQRIYEDILS